MKRQAGVESGYTQLFTKYLMPEFLHARPFYFIITEHNFSQGENFGMLEKSWKLG